jgi:hypothetical protein
MSAGALPSARIFKTAFRFRWSLSALAAVRQKQAANLLKTSRVALTVGTGEAKLLQVTNGEVNGDMEEKLSEGDEGGVDDGEWTETYGDVCLDESAGKLAGKLGGRPLRNDVEVGSCRWQLAWGQNHCWPCVMQTWHSGRSLHNPHKLWHSRWPPSPVR